MTGGGASGSTRTTKRTIPSLLLATALALGARAVLVGRPHLHGPAAGGQAGAERVLELLRAEFVRALALTGCATPADVDAGLLHPAR